MGTRLEIRQERELAIHSPSAQGISRSGLQRGPTVVWSSLAFVVTRHPAARPGEFPAYRADLHRAAIPGAVGSGPSVTLV